MTACFHCGAPKARHAWCQSLKVCFACKEKWLLAELATARSVSMKAIYAKELVELVEDEEAFTSPHMEVIP